jgi:hypothetical protein
VVGLEQGIQIKEELRSYLAEHFAGWRDNEQAA